MPSSIERPSKIYPNWDFWLENMASGNPGAERFEDWMNFGLKLFAGFPLHNRTGTNVMIFEIFLQKLGGEKMAIFTHGAAI
jgi:hypothetical protein